MSPSNRRVKNFGVDMDNDFKFFYPVITVAQEAFRDDGPSYVHGVDVSKDGHIVYQGRLMCGESMEVLCSHFKTKRKKIVNVRLEGVKMCEKCQEKYKANLDSAWSRWASGVAKDAGATPEMIKLEF